MPTATRSVKKKAATKPRKKAATKNDAEVIVDGFEGVPDHIGRYAALNTPAGQQSTTVLVKELNALEAELIAWREFGKQYRDLLKLLNDGNIDAMQKAPEMAPNDGLVPIVDEAPKKKRAKKKS